MHTRLLSGVKEYDEKYDGFDECDEYDENDEFDRKD